MARGLPFLYSDPLIWPTCLLCTLSLPFHVVEGMLRSLDQTNGLTDFRVPDHTVLCSRVKLFSPRILQINLGMPV